MWGDFKELQQQIQEGREEPHSWPLALETIVRSMCVSFSSLQRELLASLNYHVCLHVRLRMLL